VSFSRGEKKKNLMLAERASEDDNMIFSERMLNETSFAGSLLSLSPLRVKLLCMIARIVLCREYFGSTR
jgi:hypothetical protein